MHVIRPTEEHCLRGFENWVLRTMLESKKCDVIGGSRKFYSGNVCNISLLLRIVQYDETEKDAMDGGI
jgi:hypothetical protein